MKLKFIKSGMNAYTTTFESRAIIFLSVALLVFEGLSDSDLIQQKWLSEIFIYKLLLLMVKL